MSRDEHAPNGDGAAATAACSFDYDTAFARNIGWVTTAEQQLLRHKRVAIGGLGGVGGNHLLTLVRLGIERFRLADFDTFELPNFNRQAGASVPNLGRPKLDTMVQLARDINPKLDLELFPDGLTDDNTAAFVDGTDLYVDGLDFFAVDARRRVFAACAALGVPAVTAAPLGMGAAVITFMPGMMTFEQYFGLEGRRKEEQLIRFLLGLCPSRSYRRYLVQPETFDLAKERGPSTPMACALCAGVAGSQALKILLHRADIWAAPIAIMVDGYQYRITKHNTIGGSSNPLFQLKVRLGMLRLAIGAM